MSLKKAYKLLVTGSTGLVGSRFIGLFKNKFSIVTVGRDNVDIKIDFTSKEKVLNIINSSDADIVINFAAYTNVDEAENEKRDKKGQVYTINAMLPCWLAQECKASGKRLYHISTDYVFDGKQDNRPYTEDEIPRPVNSWYAMTKYYGEQNILNSDKENVSIIRISYPYSGLYKRKLDIARAVVERLKNNQVYLGINDQRIKPTSVDDIANALSFLIQKESQGIFHVAGNYKPNKYITPYDFALRIAEIFELDSSLINPVTFLEFSKERETVRPQHTWLDTTKIESLGFKITHIDEVLKRFKNQLLNLI